MNTNEDVADFRLELTSLKKNKRTLLVKDIGYNTRYDGMGWDGTGRGDMGWSVKDAMGYRLILFTNMMFEKLMISCKMEQKYTSHKLHDKCTFVHSPAQSPFLDLIYFYLNL